MKYSELIEKLIHLSNQMNTVDKAPRDYGTGEVLYASEIHMIEAINNHKGMNASELAQILGVTSGAVNQTTIKLQQKGFIESFRMRGNMKEIYYQLTGKGEKAIYEHNKRRARVFHSIVRHLDQLNTKEIMTIQTFLDKVIQAWPQD